MYGSQTTLTVRIGICPTHSLSARLKIGLFLGRPLIAVDNLWGPERAGDKVSILDWIKFIFTTGIPGIPTFIANRPSVTDKRVTDVGGLRRRPH